LLLEETAYRKDSRLEIIVDAPVKEAAAAAEEEGAEEEEEEAGGVGVGAAQCIGGSDRVTCASQSVLKEHGLETAIERAE
jgi:hypothetical protein